MAKHTFRIRQGYPDRRLMHPEREWLIGICIFIVFIFVGSLIAGRIFMQYKNFNNTVNVTAQTVPQYQKDTVQEALFLYKMRADTFNILSKQTPDTQDNEVITKDTVDTQIDTEKETEVPPDLVF